MTNPIHKVTWKAAYVSKEGSFLADYLTELNFQPGQFIVLDSQYPNQYKVVFVGKVEAL